MNEPTNEWMEPLLPSSYQPISPRGQRPEPQGRDGHPATLTEAKLWEEPECLLGSMEEMPLRVSLLLLLGLWTLRLE